MRKKSGEERQLISSKFGLPSSQPLVCFALCTGAFSDPVLKVYTASNIKEELEVAKREFLQANVIVKKSRKVFLPKVLERFAKEASISSDDLLKWNLRFRLVLSPSTVDFSLLGLGIRVSSYEAAFTFFEARDQSNPRGCGGSITYDWGAV
ncbi:unnamed protein product, partial [Vitis vinifera]